MDDTIQLNDVVASTYDEQGYLNAVYKPTDTEKKDGDDYSEISTATERTVYRKPVDHENTESAERSIKHDTENSLVKSCDAAVLKAPEEQTTSLRRLQIVCAILGALLLVCTVTLGVIVQSAVS